MRSNPGLLIVVVVLALGLAACAGNTTGSASSTEPWGETTDWVSRGYPIEK